MKRFLPAAAWARLLFRRVYTHWSSLYARRRVCLCQSAALHSLLFRFWEAGRVEIIIIGVWKFWVVVDDLSLRVVQVFPIVCAKNAYVCVMEKRVL